jgi:hypothetical protein
LSLATISFFLKTFGRRKERKKNQNSKEKREKRKANAKARFNQICWSVFFFKSKPKCKKILSRNIKQKLKGDLFKGGDFFP